MVVHSLSAISFINTFSAGPKLTPRPQYLLQQVQMYYRSVTGGCCRTDAGNMLRVH